MKREVLYISDLDGTLLTSNRELTNYSKETLNKMIDMGLHFSVATARSSATALKILEDLNLKVPVILMNGVVIYDIAHKKYLKLETISTETAMSIINIFKKHEINGFMYTIFNEEQITYYENLSTQPLKNFHDERVTKYKKAFERVDNFMDKAVESNIIYFSFMDLYERLYIMYSELKEYQDIEAVIYRDVYNENIWFLEIHSKNASKYNAVKYLRDKFNYKKIIGFGDNLNDLPLLKACDEFYAVSNSVEELKITADGIIEDNNCDGVVKFIHKREQM